MSEFEDVLEEIGSFGPLQIQVFILVSMFETPAAWGLLVHPVFAALSPSWTCGDDSDNITMETSSVSTEHSLSHNMSGRGGWREENCSLYNSGQCDSVQYEAEYTSIITEWELICGSNKMSSKAITVLQMIAVLFGACFTGQLADLFGRKRVLFGVYVPFLLCGLASGFANSWILYLVLRIMIGALFGGIMVVNFVLPLEFVGAKWRTFCGCIGFWACGLMSLALLAYLLPNWRHLTIACYAGGIPLIFTWWFIPESPRWLLLKNRQKEAEAILTQIAKRNKRPVPDFSRLQDFVQREQQRRKDYKRYTYWDLCRNFQMSRNTAIILYAWFVSSSVYYGTTLGVKHLHGNRYLNLFLSGLVEIPALIVVVLINNRIGRRKTLTILMNLAGASLLAVLLVALLAPENRGVWSQVSLAFALIGKSGISGSWAAAQVSSAELFPTVVRNIGIGASSMAARIGLIIAPEVADLAVYHQSIPYTIFAVLGITCGLLCLLLPETLNSPLPDTLPPRVCCRCFGTDDKHQHHLVNGKLDHAEEKIKKEEDGLLENDTIEQEVRV